MANYRNKHLLDFAREAPRCFCCDIPNDGTVVPAHSNQGRDGKGMQIKAHDFRFAACCQACHMEIDQGKRPGSERLEMWERAHRATMGWLFLSGRLLTRLD